ncbi:MAG: hypothetical protein H0U67_08545 [Gemmatimonadetes bacterium]|jgi:hypothetical protein|nr:hypothetical protein [Gemmatimonadota bacterium]
MADEIRVVPEGMEVDDPEFARAQIANTRARMSGTIDEIEDALLKRKERIQHRLDPFSVVRERPFQAAGAVFGAGLVLGLLTGGDDDGDEDHEYEYDIHFDQDGKAASMDAEARAAKWENRARRLLHLAREAQGEAVHAVSSSRIADDDWSGESDDDGLFTGVRDAVADRVAPLVGGLIRQFIGGNRTS